MKSTAVETKKKILMVPLSDLTEDSRNARVHNETQIRQIAASIEEYGFTNPLLISKDNTVIAGHGRLAAAKLLGLNEVPTILLDHLTPKQQRAYIIADNKIALNATWNDELLREEVLALSELDIPLDTMGFSEAELRALFPQESQTEPTCVPSLGEDFSYQLIVQCDSEQHQAEWLEKLTNEGLTCRPLIL